MAKALVGRLQLLAAGALLVAAVAAAQLWALGRIEGGLACSLLGSFAGLTPGVLRLRHPNSGAPLDGWRRWALIVGIPAATICLAAHPWLHPKRYEEVRRLQPWRDWINLGSCLAIAPLAVVCAAARHPPSSYVRDAVWGVLALWLIVLIWTLDLTAKTVWSTLSHEFLVSAAMHLEGVVFVWIACLMVRRLRALGVHQTFASRRSRALISLMGAAYHCMMWTQTLLRNLRLPPHLQDVLYEGFALLFLAIWVFYTGLLARCLAGSILLLGREVRAVKGAPRVEAAWAARVLRLELAASVLIGFTTLFTWALMVVYHVLLWTGDHKYTAQQVVTVVVFVHRADLIINALSLAVLSGLLWQASCDDGQWAQKVDELAARGARLGSLLGFWGQLLDGRVMPSFDPERSTTNDVVRQAVLPLSRDAGEPHGGRALASIWNQGQPLLAECMVTHNWSNLFLHLVAGVAADGLGVDCYNIVAAKLRSRGGLRDLEQELRALGALERTYWVCALCVNQHAGICGGFGPQPAAGSPELAEWEVKRLDSVTQKEFPLCPCRQPKIFNDDPGPCEMNKFDDMMRLLCAEVAGFSHLVVVDAGFQVFRRAWCVAEIVEADLSGIPQRIKIHSVEMLDLHYESLAALDVRDCSASRAEDKAMILGNIHDIGAFNTHLQWAIFGTRGLFSKWVDGKERAALIGRIVRRARGAGESDDAAGARRPSWGFRRLDSRCLEESASRAEPGGEEAADSAV